MNVEITKSINVLECIRCGECKKVCKQGAINSEFSLRTNKKACHVNIGTSYLYHKNVGKKAK